MKLKSTFARSGPFPGIVMMSMWMAPLMPPWFCAANMSILGRRIDRICDFGGSLPPVKPSTRMVAPGGDIALSTCFHLVRIVGQRVDLLARQHRAERRAARVERRRLRVARDGDLLIELRELQRDAAAHVAAAHADVLQDRRREPGELHLDRVAPVGQVRDDGDARVVGRRPAGSARPPRRRPAPSP